MKLRCPLTGIVWHTDSKLPTRKTELLHPIYSLDFDQLRELVDERWETYGQQDKCLLWSALLAKSSLVVLRGPISPSAALVESTIAQLASLLTWVNCQRFQKDRFPSIVVDSPSCANIPNWLKLLDEAKADFIAERQTRDKQLTEQEEAARFDKLMRRWLAKADIDDECLPDGLARWLVTASGTPIAVADVYRWMLTKPAEVLVDSPDFTTADLEELIEQLEDWQHPTLLRLHALRALRKKLSYAKAIRTNLTTDLDWLLDDQSESQEKIASHGTFSIEEVGTPKEQPQPTISPEAEAEKLATIKARQAEMAAKAKARLEALRAGKPTN